MEVGTNLEKSSLLSPSKNIKVLAILVLLGGIVGLFFTLLVLLVNPLHGLINGLISIGFIVTFFGVRKMKRWGLYVFTVSVVLEIFAALYSIANLGATILAALVLLFFWINFKKFN